MKKLLLTICIAVISANLFAANPNKARFGVGLGYSYQNTSYLDMGSVPLGGNLSLDVFVPVGNRMFFMANPQLLVGIKNIKFGSGDKYNYRYGAAAIPLNIGMTLMRQDDTALGLYVGYKAAWHSLQYVLHSGSTSTRHKISDKHLNSLASGINIGALLYTNDGFATTLEYVKYLIPKDYRFTSSEINLTFHFWF